MISSLVWLIVSNMDEIIDIKNHSNLSKLYRITAYIIRYVRNLKAVIKRESLNLTEYVTLEEITVAKNVWLKAVVESCS